MAKLTCDRRLGFERVRDKLASKDAIGLPDIGPCDWRGMSADEIDEQQLMGDLICPAHADLDAARDRGEGN